MKPGAVARDVDRICREAVLAAGLRDRYENATGYTLGYYAPWSPRTSDFTRLFIPTADWVLEPGMVFHMYVSAMGLAFSETVAVTESGAERLTQVRARAARAVSPARLSHRSRGAGCRLGTRMLASCTNVRPRSSP